MTAPPGYTTSALDGEKTIGVDEVDYKKDVTGTGDAIETDPELDRRITRKLDFHILPWIFALWLLAFIDRSNIGIKFQRSTFPIC